MNIRTSLKNSLRNLIKRTNSNFNLGSTSVGKLIQTTDAMYPLSFHRIRVEAMFGSFIMMASKKRNSESW